jgi:predicted component of type VI protein secretion system
MNVRFVVIAPKSHACARDIRLPIVVGRADDAKFRIRDDRISRRHCELTAGDGAVWIRDLGSTNGTFLNDEQVEKNTAVKVPPDAVVRVGSCRFRVEYQAPAAQAAEEEATIATDGGASAGNQSPAHTAESNEPVAEISAFTMAIDTGKEPPVTTKADDWLPPAADDEPAAESEPEADPDAEATDSPPDDEALGDFLKGLK